MIAVLMRAILLPIVALLGFSLSSITLAAMPVMQVGLVRYASYHELKELGFQPRKDVTPWRFSIPIAWDENPYDDANWQFQLHAWRIIDPILLKYNRDQNPELLAEALSIILDWHDYHLIQRKYSSKQWYDMAVGIRAMKLAWLWGELNSINYPMSDVEMSALQELMTTHAAKLLDPLLLAEGNHAYFQLVGLRLLCSSEASLSGCQGESSYGLTKMKALLDRQFTSQGIHRENSPEYHFFTLKLLKSLHVADLFAAEVESLVRKAEIASFWLVHPNNSVVRVGDSEGEYYPAAKTSLDPVPVNGEDVLVGDYIESGYFVVRTKIKVAPEESTQLFISGMSNKNEAHKHADELSFELFHNGDLVLVDSGKYSYNSNDYRRYVVSASAHNTLSLSDEYIGPKDISGAGSKLRSYEVSGGDIALFGEAVRPGYFKHSRIFRLQPFVRLEIVDLFTRDISYVDSFLDFFSGDFEVTSNLHINPNLQLEQTGRNSARIIGKADITLEADSCRLDIIRGAETPLLGWASFSYNKIFKASVMQARCTGDIGRLSWMINLH